MPRHLERYDPVTIALHWAVAALVVFQWVGGQTIDVFPRGPLRVDARSTHLVIGALLTLLLLVRLFWRLMRGTRLPAASEGWLGALARGVHGLLYLNLAILLGLGLITEGLRGDSLFGWVKLPAFGLFEAEERHAVVEQFIDYHSLAATVLLCLAGLHAGAALIHHFLLKDGVLRRMAPR